MESTKRAEDRNFCEHVVCSSRARNILMEQGPASLWGVAGGRQAIPPVEQETGRSACPPLDVDVAVIGAGITGLTAALLLKERGRSVVVLEKETIGAGATGNTTAHLTVAIDARYHYIRRHYGAEEARLVAEASGAALEKIAEIVERYSIDCRFRRVPGYLYTEKRSRVAELKSEGRAAHEAGLDARWIEDVPLPFETRGAVLFANQAQFHPGEYLNALARVVNGDDCRIFERTHVTSIKDGVVETESGRVKARAVFRATNVHLDARVTPYLTYVMAFEWDGEHPEGLFWDTADPYHYTRWQDTSEGTFAIVGGEDHRADEDNDAEARFARLLAYARDCYRVKKPRYRWSGPILEPHGGLPLIGRSDDVYISTGYAGQGMTFGTLGAMMVADFITGSDNPWKEVFDPERALPHVTAREFLAENQKLPTHVSS